MLEPGSLTEHSVKLRSRVMRFAMHWSSVGLRPYLEFRICRELEIPRDLDGWVQFVMDFRVSMGPKQLGPLFSLRPIQRPREILELLQVVAASKPRRVLEVGSAGGGTLFLFARAAAPDALVIGMDFPLLRGEGLAGWRAALYEETFGVPPQRIRIVRGNSHDESTLTLIKEILRNEPLDFLFIDADHTYEGVRRDFELYGPLVRRGGLVAFHDIVRDSFHSQHVSTSSNSGEVPQFWEEVRELDQYRRHVLEFVEDPEQDGFGIGVLWV